MRQILKHIYDMRMWVQNDRYYADIRYTANSEFLQYSAPSFGALEKKVGNVVKNHYRYE